MPSDSSHYTRATGRLTKAPYGIYSDSVYTKRQTSTIYSVSEEEDSRVQYPLGCLTPTQIRLVTLFLSGLCSRNSIEIDKNRRAIHHVGTWRSTKSGLTIVCSVVQPHVTNAIVHITRTPISTVMKLREDYILVAKDKEPTVNTITSCPQPQGSLAVPFTDYMILRNELDQSNIKWSNTVLSKTQLIFIVVMNNKCYECSLSSTSCQIMSNNSPSECRVLAPNTKSESYSFRSEKITHGKGSGPSITVHASGSMQYQGGDKFIEDTAINFRNCLNQVMDSSDTRKFINSLSVIRDVSSFMPKV